MQRLDREGAMKKDDRTSDDERGEHLAKQGKGDTFAQVPRSFEEIHLQTKNVHLLGTTCTPWRMQIYFGKNTTAVKEEKSSESDEVNKWNSE